MYDLEPLSWLKLMFLLIIFGLLVYTFNVVMRKWLKVKKKKLFSYDHLNDKHKKSIGQSGLLL